MRSSCVHLEFPLFFLCAVQDEAEVDCRRLQSEIDTIRSEMAELKTVLYAKFGNSINLED